MPKSLVKDHSESKGERFTRLAERRATEIIVKLRLVGNLSDRKNYEYTEGQVKQLFEALEAELRQCKQRFKSLDENQTNRFTFKTAPK